MNIQWSQQSLQDMRAIHDFIARDSDHYASLMVHRIVERVEKAARTPTLGHPVHEAPKSGLREVHQDHYRIIYSLDHESLTIVTVVHMKQLLRRSRLK
jgi:plasmid stabilization system protein ParE